MSFYENQTFTGSMAQGSVLREVKIDQYIDIYEGRNANNCEPDNLIIYDNLLTAITQGLQDALHRFNLTTWNLIKYHFFKIAPRTLHASCIIFTFKGCLFFL